MRRRVRLPGTARGFGSGFLVFSGSSAPVKARPSCRHRMPYGTGPQAPAPRERALKLCYSAHKNCCTQDMRSGLRIRPETRASHHGVALAAPHRQQHPHAPPTPVRARVPRAHRRPRPASAAHPRPRGRAHASAHWPAADRLERRCARRPHLDRVSPPAARPRALAKSQRPLGLRHHAARRRRAGRGRVHRKTPRALRARIDARRRRPLPRP